MLYNDSIELETNCISSSESELKKLMENAVKANGSRIRKMIKKQLPDVYHSLCLDFPNPLEYRSQRTKTHYIYVHSGIEYFFRRYSN